MNATEIIDRALADVGDSDGHKRAEAVLAALEQAGYIVMNRDDVAQEIAKELDIEWVL